MFTTSSASSPGLKRLNSDFDFEAFERFITKASYQKCHKKKKTSWKTWKIEAKKIAQNGIRNHQIAFEVHANLELEVVPDPFHLENLLAFWRLTFSSRVFEKRT